MHQKFDLLHRHPTGYGISTYQKGNSPQDMHLWVFLTASLDTFHYWKTLICNCFYREHMVQRSMLIYIFWSIWFGNRGLKYPDIRCKDKRLSVHPAGRKYRKVAVNIFVLIPLQAFKSESLPQCQSLYSVFTSYCLKYFCIIWKRGQTKFEAYCMKRYCKKFHAWVHRD